MPISQDSNSRPTNGEAERSQETWATNPLYNTLPPNGLLPTKTLPEFFSERRAKAALVPGLFVGATTLLVGSGLTPLSYIANHISMSVAQGINAYGGNVGGSIDSGPSEVLVIDFACINLALEAAMPVDPSALGLVTTNVSFWIPEAREVEPLLAPKIMGNPASGLRLRQGINSETLVIDRVRGWARNAKHPQLVTIMLDGIIPNAADRDVIAFLRSARSLAQELGVAILVVIARPGSPQSGGTEFFVGNTPALAICDSIVSITSISRSNIVIAGSSRNDFPFQTKISAAPNLAFASMPQEKERSFTRTKILKALELGASTPMEIANATGIPDTAVRQMLVALKNSGEVERMAQGKYRIRPNNPQEQNDDEKKPANSNS